MSTHDEVRELDTKACEIQRAQELSVVGVPEVEVSYDRSPSAGFAQESH